MRWHGLTYHWRSFLNARTWICCTIGVDDIIPADVSYNMGCAEHSQTVMQGCEVRLAGRRRRQLLLCKQGVPPVRKEKKRKEKKRKEKKRKEKKRKEKTTPFGVNLMRSQVLYRAAQGCNPVTNSNRYTCIDSCDFARRVYSLLPMTVDPVAMTAATLQAGCTPSYQ